MKTLTHKQTSDILLKNKFVLARDAYGGSMAVNCGIVNLSRFESKKNSENRSNYVSISPISFMDYISRKVPFR